MNEIILKKLPLTMLSKIRNLPPKSPGSWRKTSNSFKMCYLYIIFISYHEKWFVGSEKVRLSPVGSEKVRLSPVGSEKVKSIFHKKAFSEH